MMFHRNGSLSMLPHHRMDYRDGWHSPFWNRNQKPILLFEKSGSRTRVSGFPAQANKLSAMFLLTEDRIPPAFVLSDEDNTSLLGFK